MVLIVIIQPAPPVAGQVAFTVVLEAWRCRQIDGDGVGVLAIVTVLRYGGECVVAVGERKTVFTERFIRVEGRRQDAGDAFPIQVYPLVRFVVQSKGQVFQALGVDLPNIFMDDCLAVLEFERWQGTLQITVSLSLVAVLCDGGNT